MTSESTKVEGMSGPEIVKAFNDMARQVNWKQVKKFRTLAAGRQRLVKLMGEVAKNGGKSTPSKAKKVTKEERYETKSIVIVKAESKPRSTKTELRWLDLMKLDTKTVKGFLDLMERKGRTRKESIGDLEWWRKYGRIKFE
jgi:hypothetical protein